MSSFSWEGIWWEFEGSVINSGWAFHFSDKIYQGVQRGLRCNTMDCWRINLIDVIGDHNASSDESIYSKQLCDNYLSGLITDDILISKLLEVFFYYYEV